MCITQMLLAETCDMFFLWRNISLEMQAFVVIASLHLQRPIRVILIEQR